MSHSTSPAGAPSASIASNPFSELRPEGEGRARRRRRVGGSGGSDFFGASSGSPSPSPIPAPSTTVATPPMQQHVQQVQHVQQPAAGTATSSLDLLSSLVGGAAAPGGVGATPVSAPSPPPVSALGAFVPAELDHAANPPPSGAAAVAFHAVAPTGTSEQEKEAFKQSVLGLYQPRPQAQAVVMGADGVMYAMPGAAGSVPGISPSGSGAGFSQPQMQMSGAPIVAGGMSAPMMQQQPQQQQQGHLGFGPPAALGTSGGGFVVRQMLPNDFKR